MKSYYLKPTIRLVQISTYHFFASSLKTEGASGLNYGGSTGSNNVTSGNSRSYDDWDE